MSFLHSDKVSKYYSSSKRWTFLPLHFSFILFIYLFIKILFLFADKAALFLVLFVYLFIYFWLYPTACRILVPWPGIEPAPPALEARSLNHWTTREVPYFIFWKIYPYTFYVEWGKNCTFNTDMSHSMWLLVNTEIVQVCLIHLCIACACHRMAWDVVSK